MTTDFAKGTVYFKEKLNRRVIDYFIIIIEKLFVMRSIQHVAVLGRRAVQDHITTLDPKMVFEEKRFQGCLEVIDTFTPAQVYSRGTGQHRKRSSLWPWYDILAGQEGVCWQSVGCVQGCILVDVMTKRRQYCFIKRKPFRLKHVTGSGFLFV